MHASSTPPFDPDPHMEMKDSSAALANVSSKEKTRNGETATSINFLDKKLDIVHVEDPQLSQSWPTKDTVSGVQQDPYKPDQYYSFLEPKEPSPEPICKVAPMNCSNANWNGGLLPEQRHAFYPDIGTHTDRGRKDDLDIRLGDRVGEKGSEDKEHCMDHDKDVGKEEYVDPSKVLTIDGKQFGREYVSDDECNYFLMYTKNHEEYLERYQSEKTHLILEASGRCSPPKYAQVLIALLCTCDKQYYLPIYYSFASGNSCGCYKRVLSKLQELLSRHRVVPTYITCDFDWNLMTALNETFGSVTFVPSFFFYARALWKSCSELGLSQDPRDGHEEMVFSLLCLPFLEASAIIARYCEIVENCLSRSPHFSAFFEAFVKQFFEGPCSVIKWSLVRALKNPEELRQVKLAANIVRIFSNRLNAALEAPPGDFAAAVSVLQTLDHAEQLRLEHLGRDKKAPTIDNDELLNYLVAAAQKGNMGQIVPCAYDKREYMQDYLRGSPQFSIDHWSNGHTGLEKENGGALVSGGLRARKKGLEGGQKKAALSTGT